MQLPGLQPSHDSPRGTASAGHTSSAAPVRGDEELEVVVHLRTFQPLHALHASCRLNIIHADIKPENILLAPGTAIKVRAQKLFGGVCLVLVAIDPRLRLTVLIASDSGH